jgi:hypothetical protein
MACNQTRLLKSPARNFGVPFHSQRPFIFFGEMCVLGNVSFSKFLL